VALLKDRRLAHRLVAEVLWNYMRKQQPASVELENPGVRAEVEKIRESHFAAGTVEDDLPNDHRALDPGTLARGGVYHCQKCGTELKTQARHCSNCEPRPF
jgi:hypothetical protein